MGLRSNLIRRYVQSPLIQERYSASYRGIENPVFRSRFGRNSAPCINPLQTSTAAINIHQFNTPLAMAKPKDLKCLRRHGVLERERQQIWVYCYKNPGNLRETLLAILLMDHKLLSLMRL